MGFSASLRKFAVTPAQTARIELSGVRFNHVDVPAFTMRHAGDENPKFVNAKAKSSLDLKAIGNSTSAAAIRARTLVHARLLANSDTVVSWENVNDDDGSTSPCTPDNVYLALEGMIEHWPDKFDEVFGFAFNISNFRPAPSVDVEALGKP